jgi:hypothetical protein
MKKFSKRSVTKTRLKSKNYTGTPPSTDIEEQINISSETNSIHTTRCTYFKTEINGTKVEELNEQEIAKLATGTANKEGKS